MNRILLVEDNELILKGLCYLLDQEKFEVDVCRTAGQVEDRIYRELYDLAILDIMLPDGSGYEICRRVKEAVPDTPVIFLTAKDEESDVVRGFDLGADDYVIKPFRNRELMSRIRNVLRRYHKAEREIISGKVRLDLEANRVYLEQEEVILTALEYRILVLLFQNRGRTVPRERILERIWDYAGNVVNDNTLTVYIKRIREKLGEESVITVKGIGYRVD